MKNTVFVMLLFVSLNFYGTDYFVSTNGSDSNLGNSINHPFLTINKLLMTLQPGDFGYIRGGTYSLSQSTQTSGTSQQIITIMAYNHENVVLEGTSNSTNGGRFRMVNDWYYIYGLELKNGDAGFTLTSNASHNIIENCKVHNCYYTGFYIATGASNNQFINCDAYDMYDSGTNGGNADGFGVNGQNAMPGNGNIFISCRSWHNSDDGFDVWKAGHSVTFVNCYSFNNGTNDGDGNGFKLGINSSQEDIHILKNCVAWGNRQNGFDYNDNNLPQVLYNCTAYNNGRNFKFSSINGSPTIHDIQNCISAISQNNDILLPSIINQKINSWNSVATNATNIVSDNFISVDDSVISGNRNQDGSIPESDFLKLKTTSNFIDAGVDVGLPFNGLAPDFGAFESDAVNSVSTYTNNKNLLIYPNPIISFFVIKNSEIIKNLRIYDVLGKEIKYKLINDSTNQKRIKVDTKNWNKGFYFIKCNHISKIIYKP